MCTTYVGAILVEKLRKIGAKFIDYPNLIRLNPNVPWKTRGNGSVVLRFEIGKHKIPFVADQAKKIVEELATFGDPQTNPGIALLTGKIPKQLALFYHRALHEILTIKEAEEVAKEVGASYWKYKNGRGIIGALAGIGAYKYSKEALDKDHTYEIIAYRIPENRGLNKPRSIDESSVIEMDKSGLEVFFNYDYTHKYNCICPNAPCPVFCGIRGESAEAVRTAFGMIRSFEPIERTLIFRTNQHTDFHLERIKDISKARERHSVVLDGRVSKKPWNIGSYVLFTIKDGSGEINCAVYEPTKEFRSLVRKLEVGDFVRVYGGVRPGKGKFGKTINLEKIKVLKLVEIFKEKSPVCPECGKVMTSAGKGKGYKCKKCGYRDLEAKKEKVLLERDLREGFYEPPKVAWRHLYKMISRTRVNKGNPRFLIDFCG
jgi:tRNA(Ile2)-agmatinylcytidine synthase